MSDSLEIRRLNDDFRRSLSGGGKRLMTAGIAALSDHDRAVITVKVAQFDDFSEDNDPHGEHDFGAFDHAGQRIFWKIDYYDPMEEFGSEDPADPSKTVRVLTIMLADEYRLIDVPAGLRSGGNFAQASDHSRIENLYPVEPSPLKVRIRPTACTFMAATRRFHSGQVAGESGRLGPAQQDIGVDENAHLAARAVHAFAADRFVRKRRGQRQTVRGSQPRRRAFSRRKPSVLTGLRVGRAFDLYSHRTSLTVL